MKENSLDKCLSDSGNSKQPRKSSNILETCSDKLNLSRSQQLRRKKKTLAAVRSIHCATSASPNPAGVRESKPVIDGLWTTLLGTASTSHAMATYVSQSKVCMKKILPEIVKTKFKQYQLSQENRVRSMRVLYESGLISKRKYTSIRNSCDIIKTCNNKKRKCQIFEGCEIPKIVPYKTLMKYVKSIDMGEVVDLQTLVDLQTVESVPGVYRPLKQFLLRLADLYLTVDRENPCLTWFKNEKNVLYAAISADGAPFGNDDNATGKYN